MSSEHDSITNQHASQEISAAVSRFLEHCRVIRHLSPNTLRAYRNDLGDFVSHVGGATETKRIGTDAMREYVRSQFDIKRLRPSTVKRRLAALKLFFRRQQHEGVLLLSPFHQLELSIRMPRRLPRALTAREMCLLLNHVQSCPEHTTHDGLLDHLVLVTLFTTGLRVGELVSTKLADVSVADGTIHVQGKGSRERRVYLPGGRALDLLGKYMAVRVALPTTVSTFLVKNNGAVLTTRQVRSRLKALAQRCGIARPVTPHMLRHTAATQLLEAGVDIRIVQRLLGHASIATTEIYTFVSDPLLKASLNTADTLARVTATSE